MPLPPGQPAMQHPLVHPAVITSAVHSLLRVLLATTTSASLYPAIIMPALYDLVTIATQVPQHSTAGLACLDHLKVPSNSHKAKAYMYDTALHCCIGGPVR